MTTTHALPTQITIGNHTINLEWVENENLDGFVAEIKCGIPIANFASSEDCELAIWEQNNLKSDVYLDGSGVIYYKI